MVSRTTLGVLLGSAIVFTLAGLVFRARQNRGRGAKGGRISNPKVLWLFFAIWFWFVECAVLAFEPSVPFVYRVMLGVHAASMWIRGAVELVMLHVTKNWRPPIGIAHDAFCIGLVVGVAVWAGPALWPQGPWFGWAPAVALMLIFSLVVELVYAALFFEAVEGRTTGDDGIWFADPDSERFRRINRITFACNTPQVVFQAALLVMMVSS